MAKPKPPRAKPHDIPQQKPHTEPTEQRKPIWTDRKMRSAVLLHIGAPRSGKSALVRRHGSSKKEGDIITFSEYKPTIRSSSYREMRVGEEKCRVDVCDTGGAEKNAKYWEERVHECDGLLMVFNCTDRDTFDAIPVLWNRYIELNTKLNADFCSERASVMIVATHDDITEKTVTIDEVRAMAVDLRPEKPLIVMQVSNLNGNGVAQVYDTILSDIKRIRESTVPSLVEIAQKSIMSHIHEVEYDFSDKCAPIIREQMWAIFREEKILNDITVPLFLPGNCYAAKPTVWLSKYWSSNDDMITVELDMINDVTDASLDKIADKCGAALQRLSMKACRKITASGIQTIVKSCSNIQSLVCLSNLDISSIEFPSTLVHLSIGKTRALRLTPIHEHGPPPSMTVLHINDCSDFDYSSIIGLSNLAYLEIRNADQLTPDILKQLLNTFPELYHITVSDVPRKMFTSKVFDEIFYPCVDLWCRKLMSISLLNWFDIGDGTIEKFQEYWKKMKKEEGEEDAPDIFMMNVSFG